MKKIIWKNAGAFWGKIKPFLCKAMKAMQCCVFWISQIAPAVLWVFMASCFGCLVWVLGSESVPAALVRAIGETQKPEIIKFIGWGMSGLLAAIVALALNRRADEMAKTNALTEKGYINERFKAAAENLANASPSARIASFYQFYYLAKENLHSGFRQHILDILCAHLRQITRDGNYEGKDKPTEEVRTLLDLLFKGEGTTVFQGCSANLSHAHLVGVDLMDPSYLDNSQDSSPVNFQNANLSHAILNGAQLQFAELQNANLLFAELQSADLIGANLQKANLLGADLQNSVLNNVNFRGAKGLEHADWENAETDRAEFDETDENDKP